RPVAERKAAIWAGPLGLTPAGGSFILGVSLRRTVDAHIVPRQVMKSEQRHELQKNELADWLVQTAEWGRVNAPVLVGVIVGATVVIGGYLYFRNMATESAAAQWNTFFTASGRQDTRQLESLSVRDSGTPAGQMANLMLADTDLANGIELMSTDR